VLAPSETGNDTTAQPTPQQKERKGHRRLRTQGLGTRNTNSEEAGKRIRGGTKKAKKKRGTRNDAKEKRIRAGREGNRHEAQTKGASGVEWRKGMVWN